MNRATIALSLTAMICMFAVSSSIASAASFKSSATPEAIVGEGGTQAFAVGTAVIKCTSAQGESSKIAFPTEQVVTSWAFHECMVVGLGTLNFVCANFNFHSGGTVTLGECKGELAGICKLVIPAQLTSAVYTKNAGSITIKRVNSQMKYTSSAGCIGFAKEGSNLGYEGELKWKGKAGAKLELV